MEKKNIFLGTKIFLLRTYSKYNVTNFLKKKEYTSKLEMSIKFFPFASIIRSHTILCRIKKFTRFNDKRKPALPLNYNLCRG